MVRLKQTPLVFLLLLFSLFSCSGPNRARYEVQFYDLEYSPPHFTQTKPLPVVIKVEPFNAAPDLHTSGIVYRDQSFRIKTYPYHKWRANPDELVRYYLLRDLRASGLFRAVLPNSSRSTASYVLEGSVDEFLEWDEDSIWEAVLSVNITLIRPGARGDTKRLVMQKNYRTTETCERKNPVGVVEAMSRAMARTSRQIIIDIYQKLETKH